MIFRLVVCVAGFVLLWAIEVNSNTLRKTRGQMECLQITWPCQSQMSRYSQNPDIVLWLKTGKKFRDVCRDLMEGKRCYIEALDSPDCVDVFTSEQKFQLLRILNIFEFVCNTSIDAIERNAECLFDEDMTLQKQRCPHNLQEMLACDMGATWRCVEEIMRESGKCEEEAIELSRQLLDEIKRTIPGCSATQEIKKILRQFFL